MYGRSNTPLDMAPHRWGIARLRIPPRAARAPNPVLCGPKAERTGTAPVDRTAAQVSGRRRAVMGPARGGGRAQGIGVEGGRAGLYSGTAPAPADSQPGVGGGHGCIRMGGRVWNQKVCVPKMAQINSFFCKFHFSPTMISGSRGGGGVTPLLLRLSGVPMHPWGLGVGILGLAEPGF